MIIRKATLSDIPQICEIVRITWPHTYGDILSEAQMTYMINTMYSETVLSAQFAHPDHSFFIVEEDEIAIGFAGIQRNYPTEGTTTLHKIYILPTAQGKNVGKELMHHIFQSAKMEDQHTLLLNVNRNNSARFFYEKLGFSVVKEEDIDIGNGYLMEDYVMERMLV